MLSSALKTGDTAIGLMIPSPILFSKLNFEVLPFSSSSSKWGSRWPVVTASQCRFYNAGAVEGVARRERHVLTACLHDPCNHDAFCRLKEPHSVLIENDIINTTAMIAHEVT
ncbi:hypothetical protein KCU71_g63, partial [Aureobasidium melanogenum]